jgi:nucleotide-binding universal stress UspA family protein
MGALGFPLREPGNKENEDAMLPPKLILAPIDFSDTSRAALDVAADMSSRFGAELLLVHVQPAIQDLPSGVSIFKEGQYDQSLDDKAAKQLKDLAATVAQKNVKVRTELGTGNDVGMELVRIAESEHADLMVIATHGMTGWREFAFGSVAEKVLKQGGCPVLLLRAKAAGNTNDEDKSASAASR